MLQPKLDLTKGAQALTVYGKQGCLYCEWAKDAMNDVDVGYEYIDGPSSMFLQNTIEGKITYPQIYQGDVYVGGYNALMLEFTLQGVYE